MLIHELHYHHDSAQLFARIAHEPWAILLDSGQQRDPQTGKPGSEYGHYDILVARPVITLVTRGLETTISQNGTEIRSQEDPFDLLNSLLAQKQAPQTHWPFSGGALGYFAYDLGRRLESLPEVASPAEAIPEMMVGIYDWAVVVDHRKQSAQLISHQCYAQTEQDWHALQALFDAPFSPADSSFNVTSPVVSNFSETTYADAFDKIKAFISAGDCYQVNLAQRFSAEVEGDAWVAYQKLREISPAPFMSFMQLPLKNGTFQVLSNSPERFIHIVGDHVETRPIKGTRPRSNDSKLDAAYSEELLMSTKDRAENVMIVDLLRNDLSKSCVEVKVNKLFQLQSFANVHHLVSIVVAKLKPNKTAVDVLRDCFPGGSITGAPKLRAMQIIEALEPHRRDIYCGAIGYIGFDGNMDTNIAIRTAVVNQGRISYYAGGGIVADSISSKEYKETLDKASKMKAILHFFMHK